MSPASSTRTTPERILDAAERLFATHGIGRTSVRMIAEAAEANLGALNYHFGSKHAVIARVFERVSAPINAERGAALERLEAVRPGGPHDLADLLRALYWPVFRRFVGPERARERHGLSIIVQLRIDPSDIATTILEGHENSFAPAFDRAFATTLGVDGPRLRRAIYMVNSAMWDLVGHPILLRDLEREAAGPEACDRFFDQFIAFGVGGMEAACAGPRGDAP